MWFQLQRYHILLISTYLAYARTIFRGTAQINYGYFLYYTLKHFQMLFRKKNHIKCQCLSFAVEFNLEVKKLVVCILFQAINVDIILTGKTNKLKISLSNSTSHFRNNIFRIATKRLFVRESRNSGCRCAQ